MTLEKTKKEEIVKKFRTNASYSSIPSTRVDDIIQMIMNIEKLDDIIKLTKLLIAVS